jgi:hypothetical protein
MDNKNVGLEVIRIYGKETHLTSTLHFHSTSNIFEGIGIEMIITKIFWLNFIIYIND